MKIEKLHPKNINEERRTKNEERLKRSMDYSIRRNISDHSLWSGGSPILIHLDLELTERCNNDCIHCNINRPEGDEVAKGRELKTEEWEDLLRQAAELGALSVRFTGGEPLLREDFERLYLFARRLGLRVQIFTNGRLITPRLADLFARIPPLEKIEITVYGMRPESYEEVSRRPGSWHEFRRGLELLVESRIPLVVKGALLPPNRDEWTEFESWARTLPGMEGPPGSGLLFDLRGRRDSAARNRRIRELRYPSEMVIRMWKRQGPKYREEMEKFCRRFLEPPGDLLFTCGAGRKGCVDAYGKFQPCLLLRDPALVYDLRAGTLKEALTGVFPRLKEMQARSPEYLRRCARCLLRGLCDQCPAKSWSEYGTLDTPVEYLCEVAHAQARDLGLLPEGRMGWEG